MAQQPFLGKIEQINDFSSQAGRTLIELLGKQAANSKADQLLSLVNRAVTAYDSDQLSKASALQDLMRAQGHGPDAIKNALVAAGFRAGIVGSKELKDRYEEANQAQIAKDTLDNTIRTQRLQEEGAALTADLAKFASEAGPENGYMWFEDNIGKLKANPYAYKSAMDYAKAAGLTLTPYRSPTVNNKLSDISPDQVENSLNIARNAIAKAQAAGIDTSLSVDEAVKLSNLENWIDQQAKQRGYVGDAGAYADFRENMQMAYNKLRKAAPNASSEAILQAMKLNMDNGGLWWFDQEDINIDPAKNWLQVHSANWQNLYNDAYKAKKALAVLEPAYKDNKILNTLGALRTRIKTIQDLVSTGKVDAERGRDMINNAIAKINSSHVDMAQALLEVSDLQRRDTRLK